jgi:glycosyltransferase involved in cell wall biosynthesis
MNSAPLFSLIMANYNSNRFIDCCFKSIFTQTYTNWEVICIDDCSTDSSYETIKAYAERDPRIHLYRNDSNHGLGYSRHRSASLANGVLCACLDPDDAITPDAIALMVQAHSEHPEAALISSRRFICNEKMKIIDIDAPLTPLVPKFKNNLETPWMINHFASWKKANYDRTEGFDPVMPRSTDQDLYLKLEETGKVVFLDKVLYYYRKNKNSVSLNKNIYRTHLWHIYTHINACKRRGLSIDEYDYLIKPAQGGILKYSVRGVYRFSNTIKSFIRGRFHIYMYKHKKY